MKTSLPSSTKIVAIGTFPKALTPEQFREYMPHEVPPTLQLYLDGKMDTFWMIHGGTGVVFVMNAASADEADAWLAELPLTKAKLMMFEYYTVGPLMPLGSLIGGALVPGVPA